MDRKIPEPVYNTLMKSNVNAWALWEKQNMQFPNKSFAELKNFLKPHIILLGLNPSKKLDDIRNFHSTNAGDRRLKKSIQGEEIPFEKAICTNLSGAFMTDLIHSQIEPDSGSVHIKQGAFSDFENILDQLGQKKYHVICFGGKVYDAAKGWLTNEQERSNKIIQCTSNGSKKWNITLYKVMHYSYRYDVNIVGDQLTEMDGFV